MDIGIIGLPRSGKTTIFNAVTAGTAAVAASAGFQTKPNIGVAKLPDRRLDLLEAMFKARRRVPAEFIYLDPPAAPEDQGLGISGERLNHLQGTDALLLVVRAFDDPSVPHVKEAVDPFRDAESMLFELTFVDLEILERRLARLETDLKGAKTSERDALRKNQALISRIQGALESGTAIRDQSFDRDEARHLEGYRFLTAKPFILVVNVGEDQVPEIPSLEARFSARWAGAQQRVAALCGQLEMELAQMAPNDELEFRQSMGLGESGMIRMVGLSQDVLDLTTFYTCDVKEVRAWTIAVGTTAAKAAGKIHSDFERGFIRAEVVAYDDLTRLGNMAAVRRHGLLRQEGKNYVVASGDVVNILFNV